MEQSAFKRLKIFLFLFLISALFVFAEGELQESDQNELQNNTKEEISTTEEEKLSTEILNSSYELKFMEFEDEILSPQKTADGWEVIHSQNGNVERYKYDNDYKLKEKEIWKIGGVNDSSIIQKEIYSYFIESYTVESKTIESAENKKIIFYNDEGLNVKTQEYFIKDEAQHLINETFKNYDEQNRLLIEKSVQYKYKNDYAKIDYKFETKYIYTYNNDNQNNENDDDVELPPDLDYFENDILKMQNKYTQIKGNYTSQVFFEGGLSVKSIFIDNKRTRDIYFQDNKVTRIKNYE